MVLPLFNDFIADNGACLFSESSMYETLVMGSFCMVFCSHVVIRKGLVSQFYRLSKWRDGIFVTWIPPPAGNTSTWMKSHRINKRFLAYLLGIVMVWGSVTSTPPTESVPPTGGDGP
ncbi:hypothetical protein AVEN_142445-1 [Araneus ventricosus]|uniref:Uncharacterized protein n=1 Tax=Araneus ventricosus TaxID=182803 RepID=A0A4Y2VXZ8_ARAVE|nr:hypothetical protein AVEN_142445-1 [Araneus ventricosus]